MENQGKRKDQVKFSTLMAFVGFLGVIFCIGWAVIAGPHLLKEENGTIEDNWFPTVRDTLNDTSEVKLEEYDSIPTYSSFATVRAGNDSLIVVDDILYQRNEEEDTWVPLYTDEDVMWIGGNGDTIWE